MATFDVELVYKATFKMRVSNCGDVGDALAKVREMAEDADNNQFVIGSEMESNTRQISEHD